MTSDKSAQRKEGRKIWKKCVKGKMTIQWQCVALLDFYQGGNLHKSMCLHEKSAGKKNSTGLLE